MNSSSLLLVVVIATGGSQDEAFVRRQTRAAAIVQGLRELPAPRVRSPEIEGRRWAIHSQLRDLDREAVAALASALTDDDVMLRRNVILAFYDLGHGVSATGRVQKVDIRPAVPALITAFTDPDASVRAWAIQALTGAEPLPVSSIPALNKMLKDPDTGVRLSACGALGGFGVAAAQAQANLERLLHDEHDDVRTCAGFVLKKITK